MNVRLGKILANPLICLFVVVLPLMQQPAAAQWSRDRSRPARNAAADQPYTSGGYTFKPVPYSNGAMVQVFDAGGKGVGTVINGNVMAAKDQAAIQAAYDAHLAAASKSSAATAPAPADATRTAAPQPASPSAPAPPSASPGPSSGSVAGFKYGVLDRARIDTFPSAILLDLNLLRLRPQLLDDKLFMPYFIALNNCHDQNVAKMLENELDYPDLAADYKAHAAEILSAVPQSIRMTLYRPAANAGNWTLWGKSLTLGDYNRANGAFPLQYPGAKDGVEITGDLALSRVTQDRQDFLNKFCPVAIRKTAMAGYGSLPATYSISAQAMSFKVFPLDEASARLYIDKMTGKMRAVVLNVDLHVVDAAPEMRSTHNNPFIGAAFKGEIGRVTVVESQSGENVGVLYDNHTLPSPEPARTDAQAPPVQAKAQAVNWSAGDHLYDIRMSVYIFLAHNACPDWPLTDAQNTNLNRFLDRVQGGKFQEREQYNASYAAVKNSINAQGRMNFCANRKEQRDYNDTASKVAPLGTLTTTTY